MAAFGPGVLQAVTIEIEQSSAAWLLACRDGAGSQPAPERLAIGIEMPRDGTERVACGRQASCLLEPDLPQALVAVISCQNVPYDKTHHR